MVVVLWLSSRRVGREHLTIVHSFPSVLLVTVRSQTVEANVVVVHSPVEGHERAEDWWGTLSELLLSFVNDAPTYVCIDANGRLGSPTSKHVGSLSADQETPDGERLHRFLVGAEICVCLPKNGNRQRKATKLCALRLRNQVCREVFQKDLEGIQGGTPCKHVDEHHAVCIRAIQDLARRHFESQKQGPRKHWISLRLMDCVKVLRRLTRMVCERLKREQQRAALVRWRGVPCQARERAVVAARGREAQLGPALPCWFVHFCLFCCGPKLVWVAPVAVLQLSLSLADADPPVWVYVTIGAVSSHPRMSCTGVVVWARVYRAMLCSIASFLPTCLVGASSVSFLLRCLCDRYGSYRGDSSAQSCVAPKTQEKESGVKFASVSNLCGLCWSWKSRYITVPAPLCNVAEGRQIWRMPELDCGGSKFELCGTCGSLVVVANLNL